MKVNIPFEYQVHFKPPRQPSWKNASIRCQASVEVEDIDSSAAPVLHVISDASTGGWHTHGMSESVSKFHVPGGDCVIRKHGRQYYASRFPVDEIAIWRGNKEFDPFATEIGLRRGDSEFQATLKTSVNTHSPTTLEQFNSSAGEIKKFQTERPMTDRYINMLAKRFAIIDGVLYEKVREPVLSVVVPMQGEVSIYVEEVISPMLDRFQKGSWRGGVGERVRFGIDECERALEFASRYATEHGAKLNNHISVKHVSPTQVRFRGDHEYLFNAAGTVADQLRKAVTYLPESVGHSVLDAANLIAIHNRLTPASLASARKMERELRTYLAAGHDEEKTGDFSADYYKSQAFGSHWKFHVARLTDALAHWDARDDVGLEWLDRALDALPVYDYPRRAYEVTSLADIDKLALKWEGGIPYDLVSSDPENSVIVVVEDFEEHKPLAVVIYDRIDPMFEPKVFGNPDPGKVASEVALAHVFVQSAKVDARHSLSSTAAHSATFRR
jgi:hypothetical protein